MRRIEGFLRARVASAAGAAVSGAVVRTGTGPVTGAAPRDASGVPALPSGLRPLSALPVAGRALARALQEPCGQDAGQEGAAEEHLGMAPREGLGIAGEGLHVLVAEVAGGLVHLLGRAVRVGAERGGLALAEGVGGAAQ